VLEISRDGVEKKLTAVLGEHEGIGRAAQRLQLGMPDLHVEIPSPPEAAEAPEPDALLDWDKERWEDSGSQWSSFFYHAGGGPKLGISYRGLSGQLAEYFEVEGGVLVSEVEEGSPAFKAGLTAGDVIVELAGERIDDGNDLRKAVRELDPGETVKVEVVRDGRPVSLELTVGGKKNPWRSGPTI
jgi:membrane-associated protease RseP (regulator of RpoE activity)